MGKKKVAAQSESAALEEQGKLAAAENRATRVSKKTRVDHGRVYINASYNNTVITVTDASGNVLAWSSAGTMGFSGPKKATPFASSKVIAALADKMKGYGIQALDIIVKGVGSGRDSAIRSLANQGFDIVSIKDMTPIPHNGPRPPKVRRV